MRLRTTLLATVMLLALTITGAGCAPGGQQSDSGSGETATGPEYEWRCSESLAPTSTVAEQTRMFCTIVNGLSEGRIHIEHYAGAAIGNDEENLDQISGGELFIGRVSPYSSYQAVQNLKGLPFAGSCWAGFDRLWYQDDSVIQNCIEWSWNQIGVHSLFLAENGPQVYCNSKREITTPDDFEGLKIRVPPSDVYVKTFQRMAPKGIGETIAWSEVYPSLERGVVDGSVMYVCDYVAGGYHEVAPYLTDINQMYNYADMIVNLEYWNSLPADVKELLEYAGEAAEDFGRFNNRKMYDITLQAARDAGCTITLLSPEERQAFINNVQPYELYEELYADMLEEYFPGQQMYDKLVNQVKEAESLCA